MCRLSDLTQDQIASLVAAMPYDAYFDFYEGEPYIGVTQAGSWGTWKGGTTPSIVTYTEMMQLLGKDMEFTKSDLETGVFVKQINGTSKIVLYDALCGTLIKKGKKDMEFTKSDLETGMFVKYRNGNFKIVLDDALCGVNSVWGSLSNIKEDLTNKRSSDFDIVAVYKAGEGSSLTEYLLGRYLIPIWERTEQTPAQKEMKELQAQISKLQEQAKVLQSNL